MSTVTVINGDGLRFPLESESYKGCVGVVAEQTRCNLALNFGLNL